MAERDARIRRSRSIARLGVALPVGRRKSRCSKCWCSKCWCSKCCSSCPTCLETEAGQEEGWQEEAEARKTRSPSACRCQHRYHPSSMALFRVRSRWLRSRGYCRGRCPNCSTRPFSVIPATQRAQQCPRTAIDGQHTPHTGRHCTAREAVPSSAQAPHAGHASSKQTTWSIQGGLRGGRTPVRCPLRQG